jgi:hypothetical protein
MEQIRGGGEEVAERRRKILVIAFLPDKLYAEDLVR